MNESDITSFSPAERNDARIGGEAIRSDRTGVKVENPDSPTVHAGICRVFGGSSGSSARDCKKSDPGSEFRAFCVLRTLPSEPFPRFLSPFLPSPTGSWIMSLRMRGSRASPHWKKPADPVGNDHLSRLHMIPVSSLRNAGSAMVRECELSGQCFESTERGTLIGCRGREIALFPEKGADCSDMGGIVSFTTLFLTDCTGLFRGVGG